MIGIRKKIITGFLALAFLLFFAGIISFLELNRLTRATNNILETSSRNMKYAKEMLDAVQDQNTALIQMVVFDEWDYDSLYMGARMDFDAALAEITVTIRDLSELDSIYTARERYDRVVNAYLAGNRQQDADWFVSVYRTSYYDLTSSIKAYLVSSQSRLGAKARQLESNAYRAITPSIIAISVALLIIFMFLLLIDLYYVRPTLKINRGLQNYINSRVPFEVKMEGKDEIMKLKEGVETLINMYKNKKTE